MLAGHQGFEIVPRAASAQDKTAARALFICLAQPINTIADSRHHVAKKSQRTADDALPLEDYASGRRPGRCDDSSMR